MKALMYSRVRMAGLLMYNGIYMDVVRGQGRSRVAGRYSSTCVEVGNPRVGQMRPVHRLSPRMSMKQALCVHSFGAGFLAYLGPNPSDGSVRTRNGQGRPV